MHVMEPCPCQNMSEVNQVWMEQRVVAFFRLWHMIFLCSGGVLAFIILLCCCFKCRIPRTKQEIETDFRRNKVTRKFRRELDKMQMEEIDVKDIQGDKVRDKFHRKLSLVTEGNEEAGPSGALSTIKSRLAKFFSMSKKPKKDAMPTPPDDEESQKESQVFDDATSESKQT